MAKTTPYKDTSGGTSGGSFPATRLRRQRAHDWSRRLMREVTLTADNLLWPLFIRDGDGDDDYDKGEPIAAMPGVGRLTIKQAVAAAKHAAGLGIPAIALFPRIDPAHKDKDGSHAHDPDNLVCRATAAIAAAVQDIGIITDVALDPFTSHGHDGIIRDGRVDNDTTLAALCRQAVVQAKAGASVIAPSDMMDGRVAAIRAALDEAGFADVMIMAYAAKYASAFYGPFRDAVGAGGGATGIGKETYQMDPANSDEALREIALDIEEGADSVMVKPAMPYLDIIRRAGDAFPVPLIAYQVSGEYAMIEAAAAAGYIDRKKAITESLVCLRRAGADAILTYYAREVAEEFLQ